MKKPLSLKSLLMAYADDLTIITGRPRDSQKVLDTTGEWLNWTITMKAKPPKCRALAAKVFTSGADRIRWEPHSTKPFSSFDPLLLIDTKQIAAIGPLSLELEDKFKFLGKFFRFDLKDGPQEALVYDSFLLRLNTVNLDLVNGLMKAWLFQFWIIPSLAWPFQVYDFPLAFAKTLDVLTTRFLKQWLGLFKGADVGLLYRSRENHGLGFTKPSLLLKQSQLIKLHLVKHSQEGPEGNLRKLHWNRLAREMKFSRRWKPGPTLEEAEAKLSFETKFAGQTDKKGLGHNRYIQNMSASTARKRISLGLAHDHDRKAELHSMTLDQQGGWTQWRENAHPLDLKWKDLIFLKNSKIFSHHLNASVSCLPSPNRLHLWGYIPSSKCPLCEDQKCTQMHIFSSCLTALHQGRYTWRHDSVLKCMEHILTKHITSHNDTKLPTVKARLIKFVKKGGNTQSKSQPLPRHLLISARDWQCQFDFKDDSFVFPTVICITSLRPDIVIWSCATKTVILIELTCPSEENILQAKARKSARYLPLLNLIQSNGWSVSLFLVEAGVRGCLSFSFAHCLRQLGLQACKTRELCKSIQTVVTRCSYIIFQSHKQPKWARQQLLTIR